MSMHTRTREELQQSHGQVWSTKELQRDYTVESYGVGRCVVLRKSDNVRGSLDFQHRPRFYYGFIEA